MPEKSFTNRKPLAKRRRGKHLPDPQTYYVLPGNDYTRNRLREFINYDDLVEVNLETSSGVVPRCIRIDGSDGEAAIRGLETSKDPNVRFASWRQIGVGQPTYGVRRGM